MRNTASLSRLWTVVALTLTVVTLGASPGVALAATDRCALLKDAEIDEAIGPHGRGTSDVNNPWGTNSCRWVATNAPAGKAPEGWRDSIEVGVFEGSMTSWGKGQARGEPIEGVAKDAKWDRIQAELWFDCAGGRVCAVKVRTAASKGRQVTATKFAKLVDARLR
jgi:hypothetical protein